MLYFLSAFSVLTLLVGRQEGHPACKKTEWWGTGMVICLEQVADLHTAQLMPLPLTVSRFSKIQIGFTFLVLAHLGSPGKRAVKQVCVSFFSSFALYLYFFVCLFVFLQSPDAVSVKHFAGCVKYFRSRLRKSKVFLCFADENVSLVSQHQHKGITSNYIA